MRGGRHSLNGTRRGTPTGAECPPPPDNDKHVLPELIGKLYLLRVLYEYLRAKRVLTNSPVIPTKRITKRTYSTLRLNSQIFELTPAPSGFTSGFDAVNLHRFHGGLPTLTCLLDRSTSYMTYTIPMLAYNTITSNGSSLCHQWQGNTSWPRDPAQFCYIPAIAKSQSVKHALESSLVRLAF
eukprot:583674-Prorocentrum_minimum.AAC.1